MNRRMLEEAEKTFLTEEGFCSSCQQWLELTPGKNYLPDHQDKEGKKCKNSRYSANRNRYLVRNADRALQLAKMIAEDDGACLSNFMGHSLACGDGQNCHHTRLELAKALANFLLQNHNIPQEKKTG